MSNMSTAFSVTPRSQRALPSGEREREMFRLRVCEGLTLGEIGERFGMGAERARYLINRYVHRTTGRPVNPGGLNRAAKAIREAANLGRAQRT